MPSGSNHGERRFRKRLASAGEIAIGRRMTGWILALAGWLLAQTATLEASAQVPPIAPGTARVWILRQYLRFESLALPMTYVNGARLAISQPGTALFRDY